MSYRVVSCHDRSFSVLSCCHILHVTCYRFHRVVLSCHVIPYHVKTGLAVSCHVLSFQDHLFDVLSCRVMSGLFVFCLPP